MPLIFTDRCDVYRRATTAQGYGSKPAYSSLLSDQPFLLVTKSQRGFNSITAEWVTTTLYTGHFPTGADVQEGDQLQDVVLNRNGETETFSGTFQVDGGAISRRGRGSRIQIVGLKRVS